MSQTRNRTSNSLQLVGYTHAIVVVVVVVMSMPTFENMSVVRRTK